MIYSPLNLMRNNNNKRCAIHIFILSLVFGLIAVFIDIKPQYDTLQNIKTKICNTKERLAIIHKRESYHRHLDKPFTKNDTEMIADLFKMTNAQGLTFQEMQFLSYEHNSIKLRLTLSGQYDKFVQLAKSLANNAYPMRILDFILSESREDIKKHITIKFTLLMLKMMSDENKSDEAMIHLKVHNPFCKVQHAFKHHGNPIDDARFSITELKMTGFFEDSQHRYAILLMPNQVLKEISLGESIGREKAKVIDIGKNAVTVKLNNGKCRIISR